MPSDRFALAGTASAQTGPATRPSDPVALGRYVVQTAGCNDCHTPGYFLGKPDTGRFLGGSEVGFEIPDQGVFYGSNLTPDRETGLGRWSTQEIVTAITTGQRPDGRVLAPVMPWNAFSNLAGSLTKRPRRCQTRRRIRGSTSWIGRRSIPEN